MSTYPNKETNMTAKKLLISIAASASFAAVLPLASVR